MEASFWLPLLILLSSALTGLAIFLLREEQQRARTVLNLLGASAKLVLVAVVIAGTLTGKLYETRLAFLPEVDLLLRVDEVSLLFVSLSAVLWLLTTIYAIGYLEGSPRRSRFFGFFSLCVTATMGIALAGNLLTFFVFYELLTLTTYPLVVHRQTPVALAAGRTYLAYAVPGAALLLAGVGWLHLLAGPVVFEARGALGAVPREADPQLVGAFVLLVGGLGVKTALVPLHGWLPKAMVAPAPVSALLHAVAVVKAGAYGVVRVVEELYGLELAGRLGLLPPLAALAGATILWGSLRALSQDDLKRRLAFSTVSQVSYIVLGASLLGPLATAGGLVHLVHQGLMKITLFFCAGLLAETLGIKRVEQLRGVGRRMPLTMAAFSVAALGMVGLPPLAGFVSKWHIGVGAVEAGQPWVVAVLAASTLLNAAHFLPPVWAAWQPGPAAGDWPPRQGRLEAPGWLLVPALVTGALSVASGLLAAAPFSPLGLARRIAEGMYP